MGDARGGDVRGELSRIGEAVRRRFTAQKRVLSYHEYLDIAATHPARHTRDAARYLRDTFDHYGSYMVERPWGEVRRYRLFDLSFEGTGQTDDEGAPELRSDHLVGHEYIQKALYRILQGFVREGRANRLVLLHGPNGSAKSTLTRCLMRALEHYSAQDEGALYRFSWIFPRGSDGKGIGFGSTSEGPKAGESYAHLPDERIDVKLPSSLREHPLLLLPRDERSRFITSLYEQGGVEDPAPDSLWRGRLGHKSRQIFEALLTAYRGDLDRVLAHVQVERWYISRRYRTGAVTIGPQMAVDASERQITADRTLGSLPASLSAVTLFEPYGELVDASGGVVEYSDLLKRPLDAWKYLLLAIENGEVALPLSNLPINAVMLASSNEGHLNAFKEHPEYKSFRGRLLLVRVPYLLDYELERGIYDAQIVPQVRRHVAPHTTYIAALWAVLTRLHRAQPERYSAVALGRVAADLSPLEKAELYASGTIPGRLGADEAKTLRGGMREVHDEMAELGLYEGLTGASPREIRQMLLDTASDKTEPCLSPRGLLARIELLCKREDYGFLKLDKDHGYQDHVGFVAQVRGRWLDKVDDELRTATGLIEEGQYESLFDQYVAHVSFHVKKERLLNSITGKYEDPDTKMMESVEEMLGATSSDEFRRDLIGTVAAHAIDHPGEEVDYERLFPRYLELVKQFYFGGRKKQLGAILDDALALLDGRPVEPEREPKARETLDALCEQFGYEESSARIALGELAADRYWK